MWKLSVATGNSPWLTSLSDFPGRQVWEYDADAGTPEERAAVEDLRAKFAAGRETMKHSSDELMRLQVIPPLRLRLTGRTDVTYRNTPCISKVLRLEFRQVYLILPHDAIVKSANPFA